jgi:putative membrane protein
MLWWYEMLPAFVLVIALIITYKRFPLTPMTYWIVFFGTITMLIGSHYTYGGVPLFHSIQKAFHWKRNNFDRFGHIFQGMIVTTILREYFLRTNFLNREKWVFLIVGMLSISFSALYEILEFGIGFFFDGNIQSFLGYQGDIFDSHWDIISALSGTVVVLILGKIQDHQMKNLHPKSILHPRPRLQPN